MICGACQDWDADANARFCGNCGSFLLPVAVRLTPDSLDFDVPPADLGAVKASVVPRKGNFGGDDFKDLALFLRALPDGRPVASYPLESLVRNAKSSAIEIPLTGNWLKAGDASHLTLEPVFASDEKFLRHVSPSPSQPRIRLSEPAPKFQVDEHQTVWRREQKNFEIPVQLVEGGAATIAGAKLKLRGADEPWVDVKGGAEVELQWSRPDDSLGVVDQDRPLLLVFSPAPDQSARLRAMSIPLQADLSLVLSQDRGVFTQTLRIAQGGLPQPVVVLCDGPVDALAGRRTRIGLAIRNSGGGSFDVIGCSWKLLGPANESVLEGAEEALRFLPALPITCQMGETKLGELAISLRDGDEALALGRYDVELSLECSNRAVISALTSINVKSADRVVLKPGCIDFGTTESGAALFLDTGDDTNSEWPKAIELGRVSFQAGNESFIGRSFVPTIAAAGFLPGGGVTWSFGYEAQARIERHPKASPEKLCVYERLKWSLATEEKTYLPNNDPIENADVAAQYIAYIIDLLETHPKVCARVEHAFITKPAVFKDGQSQILVHAFEEGRPKFVERFWNQADGTALLISESWSPMYAALPPGHRLRKEAFLDQVLVEDEILAAGVNVVVFDVGGGSLDVSLFMIEEHIDADNKSYAIRESVSMTSTTFCGGAFATLIDAEIERVLVELLAGDTGARSYKDLGVAVEGERGAVNEDIVFNRAALARLRNFLQWDTGPFGALVDKVVDIVRSYTDKLGETALKNDISVAFDDGLRRDSSVSPQEKAELRRDRKVVLRGHGGLLPATITIDKLETLMARIALAMNRRYQSEIERIFTRIGSAMQKEKTRVLITGRGSLFPVARGLLAWHATDSWKGSLYFTADGDAAKWITSVGGALVGLHNIEGVPVEFSAHSSGVFAVKAGRKADLEYSYIDLQPNVIDATQRVGVVRLERLKKPLGHPRAKVEIVKRFDSGVAPQNVLQFPAANLGPLTGANGWLALCWNDGAYSWKVVNAPDEESALRAAEM